MEANRCCRFPPCGLTSTSPCNSSLTFPAARVLPLQFRSPSTGLRKRASVFQILLLILYRISKIRKTVSNFDPDPIQFCEKAQECFKFRCRSYTVFRKSDFAFHAPYTRSRNSTPLFHISPPILYRFAKKRTTVSHSALHHILTPVEKHIPCAPCRDVRKF